MSNTKRKEQSYKYLKKIIDDMPGNICWENTEGVFLGCNKTLLDYMGLQSEHEFIGKTPYDILPKKIADLVIKGDRQVIKTGKSTTLEEEGVNKDGNKRFFLIKRSPLRDFKGNIEGILYVAFDITDKCAFEEL